MMRVYQVVLLAVVTGTAIPLALHHRMYGGLDADQVALAFFLWLNVIIALWEICLFLRIDHIEIQHARFVVEYKGRELDRVKDFFGARLALGKIFSPTTWAELWSSYSIFDESYANRRSFGFFVDIGNGFSTLIPSLVCLYGMSYELMPARALGLVMLLVNYQMWYGTVIYVVSFLFNRRYVGHTRFNLALFVGLSNGLWLVFPLWGMYAAITMIYSGSYAIFRP
jgi:hypothetical protein